MPNRGDGRQAGPVIGRSAARFVAQTLSPVTNTKWNAVRRGISGGGADGGTTGGSGCLPRCAGLTSTFIETYSRAKGARAASRLGVGKRGTAASCIPVYSAMRTFFGVTAGWLRVTEGLFVVTDDPRSPLAWSGDIVFCRQIRRFIANPDFRPAHKTPRH